MKNYSMVISFLFLTMIPANSQTTEQEQLWLGLSKALQEDVNQKKKVYITRGIDELKKCLSKPYSKNSVENANKKISELRNCETITKEQSDSIEKYEELISGYAKETGCFINVFTGEIKGYNYSNYRNKKLDELEFLLILDMAREIYEHYQKNGVEGLNFDTKYVYLNKKLQELKDGFKEIAEMEEDKAKAYEKLVKLIKIESEISEEHKEYKPLKQ